MTNCKDCFFIDMKLTCLNCQYCIRNPTSKQIQDCYTKPTKRIS